MNISADVLNNIVRDSDLVGRVITLKESWLFIIYDPKTN